MLGRRTIPRYRGYDPSIDATIANEFSTAAFRLGHSMLNERILRLDARGEEVKAGHLALRDAFFAPDRVAEAGIAPILRGLAAQRAQRIDPYVIDDVRNFLFGPPGAGGLDLASLNVQRGRDHGLRSYNDTREAMGFPRAGSVDDVSRHPEVRTRLAAVCDHVDDLDLWVGGLAEDHARGALVGPLFQRILSEQFQAPRDGDRFWHERTLPSLVVGWLKQTRLSTVIRRNTEIGSEIPNNVFKVPHTPRR